MRRLAESMFDKDLVSKGLDIEKLTNDFSSDALQELSEDENMVKNIIKGILVG